MVIETAEQYEAAFRELAHLHRTHQGNFAPEHLARLDEIDRALDAYDGIPPRDEEVADDEG